MRKMDITERLREWSNYDDPPGVTLDDLLNEAADDIERLSSVAMQLSANQQQLIRERDEARQLVIEANNSLYGSQGYFHSLNGGEFDKYHLSRGIEDLKTSATEAMSRSRYLESSLREIGEAELHSVARADIWMRDTARACLYPANRTVSDMTKDRKSKA